ncbi:hypothetical protein MVLG_05532 [Microbotryum lychnidis-dioicae p1A1 Lamole]|uniref:DUF1857-domain-containing protein n=1 Tax=Microbotryum lychnidis-dioicae (strain p1A1 Lamole / MvSl-1064) TaxID=683840 RepID=U5HEI9_USTV1|nr:hypothetical protein MVLG_05532 [Microbotryum lychnidis-dioicae p1A1 Lamole]|eukprot:KDE04031.1 hypothetical protein MVLG_05532 [Microbotryum lychnidis-dioicae p1A1 Lamole]
MSAAPTSPPSFAATRPINPPGAEPRLTKAEVWKALTIKTREPQEFVPMIRSCKVVKEEGNKITRHVKFGSASSPTTIEECTLYEPTIVYFDMTTAPHGHIINLVSHDPQGELQLTYSFSNGVPTLSKEDVDNVDKANKVIGDLVQHSIDTMRKLHKEGRL